MHRSGPLKNTFWAQSRLSTLHQLLKTNAEALQLPVWHVNSRRCLWEMHRRLLWQWDVGEAAGETQHRQNPAGQFGESCENQGLFALRVMLYFMLFKRAQALRRRSWFIRRYGVCSGWVAGAHHPWPCCTTEPQSGSCATCSRISSTSRFFPGRSTRRVICCWRVRGRAMSCVNWPSGLLST